MMENGDWLKPCLLEKSVEALWELGIESKDDEVIAEQSKQLEVERRGFKRFWIEIPVIYRIGRNTLTGSTVNVCKKGMMVESSLSWKTALKTFKTLNKKPGYPLQVQYTYKGKTHRRDTGVKHFHLDF